MRIQYASGREQLCAVEVNPTLSGSIPAGTYYFWLQGRNDVGFNKPSEVAMVTVNGSQGIELTIPELAFMARENWLRYVVLVNTVNNAANASILLTYDFKPTGITLPYQVVLSLPSHIELEREVTSFPTTNLVNGLTLLRTSDNTIYYYVESTNQWKKNLDGFNTGVVTDTTNVFLGCDTDISELTSTRNVIEYDYALDGSRGFGRKYWIYNETPNIFPKDRQFGLTCSIQDNDVSSLFYNLFQVIFDGYFDRNTQSYITEKSNLSPFSYLDIEIPFSSNQENLVVEEDLLPNQAFQFEVFPEFNSNELGIGLNLIPIEANIDLIPFIVPDQGVPTDLGELLGDAILGNDSNLRRVYPNTGLSVIVDSGISLIQNRIKRTRSATSSFGFVPNTANQVLAINSNGTVYPLTQPLRANERQRALISTLAGTSEITSFSDEFEGDNNPNIEITVTYPNIIREGYDDVIAGVEDKGVFNAEEILVFVRKRDTSGGAVVETRQFLGLTPTNTESDTFTFLYENGVVYTDPLPTVVFGLWTPQPLNNSLITVENLTTTNYFYDIAIAYGYSGLSITDISHKTSEGCIYEFTTDLASIGAAFEGSIYWKVPVTNRLSLSFTGVSNLLDRAIYPVVSAANNLPALYMYLEADTNTPDNDQYVDSINGTGNFVKISGGSTGGGGEDTSNVLADAGGELLTDASGTNLIFI